MIIITDNYKKFQEICNLLQVAHYKVVQQPVNEIISLTKKHRYALREQTELLIDDDNNAQHQSTLTVWSKKALPGSIKVASKLFKKTYVATVYGYIDHNAKTSDPNVYNWDDVFIVEGIDLSYHEMKQHQLKRSARSLVVNEFLNDVATFDKRLELKWEEVEIPEVVYFNRNSYKIFTENSYLTNPVFTNSDIYPIYATAINRGVFFRSASNRWQKNYWLPGLNAGVPLTAKSDPIHEATFMIHDIYHFSIPDLIPDSFDKESIRTYLGWRMISEAITMVMADMIFVDTLVKSGYSYDWDKRRIYPVFREISPDASLYDILVANISFFVLGNPTPYFDLGVSKSTFQHFADKYTDFAVEDMRWTQANINNMANSSLVLERWQQIVGKKRLNDLFLSFTSKYRTDLVGPELIFYLFDQIWYEYLTTSTDFEVKPHLARSNAFLRYMAGQMVLFAKFGFIQGFMSTGSQFYNDIWNLAFKRGHPSLSGQDIKGFREEFNTILSDMETQQMITPLEQNSFSQIVPMFDPFYVFYDQKGEKPTIEEMSEELFG